MRIRASVLLVAFCGGVTAPAFAQAPSVVQLPSFSFFTVDTTVSVPDRGTANLGGIGRSSTGSTAFGPALGPANRAFGRSQSASNVAVRASIHDLDALDRATLKKAGAHPGGSRTAGSTGIRRARTLAAAPTSSAERVPSGSVADARRLHAAEAAAQETEALANLEHARQAAAKGKASVAKIFYKLALKQAPGKLKPQISRELAALSK